MPRKGGGVEPADVFLRNPSVEAVDAMTMDERRSALAPVTRLMASDDGKA